jgi:ABC-type Zn uptake system ZnuABC Zn-binding protein ZnuA
LNKKKIIIAILLILICQLTTLHTAFSIQNNTKIVATISAIATIINPVLTTSDTLTILLPSNTEPHSFSLNPLTVQKALDADILVSSGHIGWEKQLENQVLERGGMVFDPLSQMNNSLILLNSPIGGKNIHGYWLNPENVKLIATEFTKKIKIKNPSMSQVYEENLQKYIKEIANLESFALDSVKEKGLYEDKVVIGFYEEQYIAESFGLKPIEVLAGDEENMEISPQKMDNIRKGLINGTISYLIVSDIALELPLNDYIRKISDETNKPICYVRTLDIPGIYDFRELYSFNLGNILNIGNLTNNPSDILAPDVYLEIIAALLVLNITFGYILFARIRK